MPGEVACPVCKFAVPDGGRFCSQCGEPLDGVGGDEEGATVADPLIGRVVHDRYRIASLLGRGGMGVVYKVEHVHIGKIMAMKLLHGELSRKREIVQRFRREADAASRLNHHNTVQTFDFGRDGGMMYLVMEYLDGHDMGWLVRQEGPQPFARVARIGSQVCASVGEAHDKGIIHRDIKPENIFLVKGREDRDMVKVLDFGLAKLRHHDSGVSLTNAGAILGTPYYMAPEHIKGDNVDPRSDVYALGATLYKAVTGVPPFTSSTPMGVLTKHLTETLPPPSKRVGETLMLSPSVDRIIGKAMARSPDERFQTMDEMRRALMDYLVEIGEEKDATGQFRTGDNSPGAGRMPDVATRGDVDRYERKIKTRGRLSMLLVAALLGAGLGAGWYAYNNLEVPDHQIHETEPNNTPGEANRLDRGVSKFGYLGKRIDARTSDADVYAIERPGVGTRHITFEVKPIPNMDVVVDVVRAGVSKPVLELNGGGVGEGERVPAFPMSGNKYFLRVRERWVVGRHPSENISDPYEIRWDFAEVQEGFEVEVNNTIEQANRLAPGETIKGYIGWNEDKDVYCVEGELNDAVLTISGVPNIDLVLTTIDRSSGDRVAFDNASMGEAEQAVLQGEGPRCFEVAAVEKKGVGVANNVHTYAVAIENGAGSEAMKRAQGQRRARKK